MYTVKIDQPAYIYLNAVAADVSEFFFDTSEGKAFIKVFRERLGKVLEDPYKCKEFDGRSKRFDFSYRGFEYYAVFTITADGIIFISDIFNKRQNIKKRY